MKLYGALASPYVTRVILTARWKGIDLPATMPPGGMKSAEHLALNPLGKIPTLDHDGECIAESTVICEFLDETHAQNPLMPSDAAGRARVRLLARVMDLYVLTHIATFFRNMNPAQRNQAEVDAAHQGVLKALADLDKFMGPGPWAYGDSRTLADSILAPSFFVIFAIVPMFGIKDLFAATPKLARWWAHIQADPVAGPLQAEYTAAFLAFARSRAA